MNQIRYLAILVPLFTFGNAYAAPHSDTDFGGNGRVDWYRDRANISFLNLGADYGGFNQWAFPRIADDNTATGSSITTSELGERHYQELPASIYPAVNSDIVSIRTASDSADADKFFSIIHTHTFWSDKEHGFDHHIAWELFADGGNHGSDADKRFQLNTPVVSSGQVSTVPVSSAGWLFGSALVGFVGLNRRKLKL
jgi:hypothetical protein